jgi:DNA polymerase-1
LAVGPLSDARLRLVENLDDALAFKRWLGERRPVLAFDTETGGLEWWREPLRLVQFGDAMSGWALPWGDWAGVVKEAFREYEGELVAHNAVFDMHFLEVNGVRLRRDQLHDTQVMAHLLDPTRKVGLKPLSDALIDPRASAGQATLQQGFMEHKWTWRTVPVDFPPYWLYATLDTVITARLHEMMRPEIDARYREAYDLEMAVALVIADMERRGFRADLDYTRTKLDELDAYTDEARAYCKATWDVSPTSTRQVCDRLIADGIRLTKKTPGGAWKLDEEVLAGLSGQHPLSDMVGSIRQAGKFAKTYFGKILNLADGDVVHASVNPLGARTARMSVSNPPLQQLPSDSPLVRDCFLAREGNRLITIDFDQIEARLLAHFSGEPTMIEAILGGVDLHTFMAGKMYGTAAPTKQQRKMSKSGTFGKIYGIGVQKFATQQGVSPDEARAFLAMFDQTFAAVPQFIRQVETVARQRLQTEGTAYITTPVGRRHPLGPYDGDAFYKLVNYLIQGTAADVLKQKLVALDCAGLGDYLILPVHDEVIFDVPEKDAEVVAASALEIMQDFTTWAVPLTAGADIVTRWGDKYREAA